MTKKIKGIDSIHTHIEAKCENCGFVDMVRECEPVICFSCWVIKDKRIVMIKTKGKHREI